MLHGEPANEPLHFIQSDSFTVCGEYNILNRLCRVMPPLSSAPNKHSFLYWCEKKIAQDMFWINWNKLSEIIHLQYNMDAYTFLNVYSLFSLILQNNCTYMLDWFSSDGFLLLEKEAFFSPIWVFFQRNACYEFFNKRRLIITSKIAWIVFKTKIMRCYQYCWHSIRLNIFPMQIDALIPIWQTVNFNLSVKNSKNIYTDIECKFMRHVDHFNTVRKIWMRF